VVASSNAGKLRELNRMLEPLGFETVSQSSLGIEPAPEPHPTFVENALAKARHAAAASGLPALADDSGVCVPALGGAPGVYSARFAQMAGKGEGDGANNAYLIECLTELAKTNADAGVEQDPFAAYYYCVLVWLESPTDPQPLIADARWHGRIITSPRGEGGFGYDPYFELDGGKTAAEMSAADKNSRSHRGQAMSELSALLTASKNG
jgi:XTP/dITP diphosphohydrolase